MKRPATAIWQGTLLEGGELLTSESFVLSSLPSAFEVQQESQATTQVTPVESLVAAHAGCLSVVLSGGLKEPGCAPDSIQITAAVTLNDIWVQGWKVTGSHLVLSGKVPRLTTDALAAIEL